MIKVGIIGGAGYTAGELIRLLLHHEEAKINFVYSTSNAGNKVSSVHQDLLGSTDLKFTGDINSNIDVLFLCLGHGNSKAFLETNSFSDKTKIIDLSNDFRLEKDELFQNKNTIRVLNFVPLLLVACNFLLFLPAKKRKICLGYFLHAQLP